MAVHAKQHTLASSLKNGFLKHLVNVEVLLQVSLGLLFIFYLSIILACLLVTGASLYPGVFEWWMCKYG